MTALRKRNREITKDIGDLFNLVINYCSDTSTLRESFNNMSHFNDTYLITGHIKNRTFVYYVTFYIYYIFSKKLIYS